jgi:phosphohistidine phosphatase
LRRSSLTGVRLYLVRHAEAESGEPDELRKLSAHGREQAREVGERFAADRVRPEVVLSSPLLRARETAEAIAKATGATAEPDERLAPGATADDLRSSIAGRGKTVVVVGHQPDCGQIAASITGEPEPKFPTAGVCELEL